MMKYAQDWSRDDLAAPLHGPMARRILGQRQMRPDFIIIVGLPGIEWVIGEIIAREKLVDRGLSAL